MHCRQATTSPSRKGRRLRLRTLRAALLLLLLSLAAAPFALLPGPAAAQSVGRLSATAAPVTVDGQCGPPVVSVSASPQAPAPGQSVTFTYSAVAGNGCTMATAPLPTLLINFGDGTSPLPLTGGPSGTIDHTYNSTGSYTAIVSARSGNQTGTAQTAALGQSVTFTYSAVAGSGCTMATAPLPTLLINFGDGSSPLPLTDIPSGSISHTYSNPGTYTVTVSANSAGQIGTGQTSVTIMTGGPSPQPGPQVVYGGGWNLIGVPDGTVLPPTDALYTWQTSANSYATATATQAGKGYWAFFPNNSNPIFLPQTSPSAPTLRINLPAGQWVMIGNPYSQTASVSGADVVFAYDPMSGYRSVTTLAPGLGAWAFSASGGTVVIAPALLR
jgi:hypothetical protein